MRAIFVEYRPKRKKRSRQLSGHSKGGACAVRSAANALVNLRRPTDHGSSQPSTYFTNRSTTKRRTSAFFSFWIFLCAKWDLPAWKDDEQIFAAIQSICGSNRLSQDPIRRDLSSIN